MNELFQLYTDESVLARFLAHEGFQFKDVGSDEFRSDAKMTLKDAQAFRDRLIARNPVFMELLIVYAT